MDTNNDGSTIESDDEYNCVTYSDLREHYRLCEHYEHKCSACKEHASVVEGFTDRYDADVDRHIRCPKCVTMMEIKCTGDWD